MFARKFIKILHTAGAIGLAGGLAAFMLMAYYGPEPAVSQSYADLRSGLEAVSAWLILPSMLFVLVSGVLSMAVHHPFQNAEWVWAKLLAGVLVFEATLASVDGPAAAAASAARDAVDGLISGEEMNLMVSDKWGAWWMLLALSLANVILAIWRPRMIRNSPRPSSGSA